MPTANFRSAAALACFLIPAVLGVVLDLWSKYSAFENLVVAMPVVNGRVEPHSREIELIPGWLHFHATTNYGAVFGSMQGFRWIFIGISAAAIVFLLYLFARSDAQRLYQIVLGMLLAGVIGNLYDRLTYGYVRDMIHIFPRWPNLFPYIFNVADSLLCVGVAIMFLYSFLMDSRAKAKRPEHEPQG